MHPNRWFDWLPWRRPPPPIAEPQWQIALANCPLAWRLTSSDRQQLRQLAARFLERKRFFPTDMQLDATQRLLIAMQACIPVLHLGFRALRGWQSVIVYPGPFRVQRPHREAGTGVVSDDDSVLVGEAWHLGPLVLSWDTVEHDLAEPWRGENVVAHEIAHKLDMLDGPPDGVPVLPRGLSRPAWIDTFQSAFDRLTQQLAHGEPGLIDAYAATNPAEYFAVVSALHFSDPGRLAAAEPGVAACLRAYYGPSPAP
ncbi:MAG TPA: M90 family metallopeptidase [Rhodanobacteraceae bacterium]